MYPKTKPQSSPRTKVGSNELVKHSLSNYGKSYGEPSPSRFNNKQLQAFQEGMRQRLYPTVKLEIGGTESSYVELPTGIQFKAEEGDPDKIGAAKLIEGKYFTSDDVPGFTDSVFSAMSRASTRRKFWEEKHKVVHPDLEKPMTIGVRDGKSYILNEDTFPVSPGFHELLHFDDERLIYRVDDELLTLKRAKPHVEEDAPWLGVKMPKVLQRSGFVGADDTIIISKLEELSSSRLKAAGIVHSPALLIEKEIEQKDTDVKKEVTLLVSKIEDHPKTVLKKVETDTVKEYAYELPEVIINGSHSRLRMVTSPDGSTTILLSSSADLLTTAQRVDKLAGKMSPDEFMEYAEHPDKINDLRRSVSGKSGTLFVHQIADGEIVIGNSLDSTRDAVAKTDPEYVESFKNFYDHTQAYLAALDKPAETPFNRAEGRFKRENSTVFGRVLDFLMKLP